MPKPPTSHWWDWFPKGLFFGFRFVTYETLVLICPFDTTIGTLKFLGGNSKPWQWLLISTPVCLLRCKEHQTDMWRGLKIWFSLEGVFKTFVMYSKCCMIRTYIIFENRIDLTNSSHTKYWGDLHILEHTALSVM